MSMLLGLIISTFLFFPFAKSKVEKTQEVEKKQELTNVKFVKYNNPAGDKELDIFNLKQKRQVITKGIISPDISNIVYSEVYYYPINNQISSAVYILPLDKRMTPIDRVAKANIKNKIQYPIAQSDISNMQNQVFETITPVDWSYDNNKILMKKRVGEMQRGFWKTDVLIYDMKDKTLYEPNEIREAISYYWKEKKGIDLTKYRWDIHPIGWSKANSDRILVFAKGYSSDFKIHLGTWSIDYKGDTSLLVSDVDKNILISKNGLMLQKVNVDLADSIVKPEGKSSKELIDLKKNEYYHNLNDFPEIGGE